MLDLDDMLTSSNRTTTPQRVLKVGDYGSGPEADRLRDQLALLKSWADPANTSSLAVTYRDMEAAADRAIRAAGGREATTGSGTLHDGDRFASRTHGLIATYNAGCHCDDCKAAAAEYQRRKRQKAAVARVAS